MTTEQLLSTLSRTFRTLERDRREEELRRLLEERAPGGTWCRAQEQLLADGQVLRALRRLRDRERGALRRRLELWEELLIAAYLETHPPLQRLAQNLRRRRGAFRFSGEGLPGVEQVLEARLLVAPDPGRRRRLWTAQGQLGRELAPHVLRAFRAVQAASLEWADVEYVRFELGAHGLTPAGLKALLDGIESRTREPYFAALRELAGFLKSRSIYPWDLPFAVRCAGELVSRRWSRREPVFLLERTLCWLGFEGELFHVGRAELAVPARGVSLDPPHHRRLLIGRCLGREPFSILLFEAGKLVHDHCLGERSFVEVMRAGTTRAALGTLLAQLVDQPAWYRGFLEAGRELDPLLGLLRRCRVLGLRNLAALTSFRWRLLHDPGADPERVYSEVMERFTGFGGYPPGFWALQDAALHRPLAPLEHLLAELTARSWRRALGRAAAGDAGAARATLEQRLTDCLERRLWAHPEFLDSLWEDDEEIW
jgi:hypothetical protein